VERGHRWVLAEGAGQRMLARAGAEEEDLHATQPI